LNPANDTEEEDEEAIFDDDKSLKSFKSTASKMTSKTGKSTKSKKLRDDEDKK
jgi:hypothetical protein